MYFDFNFGMTGGGVKLPSDLVFFWDGKLTTSKGVDPEYSYAGNQYDEDGVSIGAIPAVHGTKGVWVGPGYTNELVDEAEDFGKASIWTKNQVTAVDSVVTATVTGDLAQISIVPGAVSSSLMIISIFIDDFQMTNAPNFSWVAFCAGSTPLFPSGDFTPTVGGVVNIPIVTDGGTINSFSIFLNSAGASGTDSFIGDFMDFRIQLTSLYAYPYVPPNTTVDTAVGSALDNGIYFPLVEGEDLKEAFSGVAIVQLAGVI